MNRQEDEVAAPVWKGSPQPYLGRLCNVCIQDAGRKYWKPCLRKSGSAFGSRHGSWLDAQWTTQLHYVHLGNRWKGSVSGRKDQSAGPCRSCA